MSLWLCDWSTSLEVETSRLATLFASCLSATRFALVACLWLSLTVALPAQDAFLDSLRPVPEPILPYSESLAPVWEGVLPSGEPQALYAGALGRLKTAASFASRLRRLREISGEPAAEPLPRPLRENDFRDALRPGLQELAAAARRCSGETGPMVLGVVLTLEVPDVARCWVVQGVHTPAVESLLRPWLMTQGLTLSFPELLLGTRGRAELSPEGFISWLEGCALARGPRRASVAVHVASGPGHPAWKALERAGALPFSGASELSVRAGTLKVGGRAVSVLYHERPEEVLTRVTGLRQAVGASGTVTLVPAQGQTAVTGWEARQLAREFRPPVPVDDGETSVALPAVRSFARSDGTPDRELVARVFRRQQKGLYDKWLARSTRFRSERGELLLDGLTASAGELARMELRVRQAPASVLAQEARRATRLGARELYQHLTVLVRGDETWVPAAGSAQAVGRAVEASWMPTLLVADEDAAGPERRSALARPLPEPARQVLERFDPGRFGADVRFFAGETERDGLRLTRRANGLPHQQLGQTLDWLASFYRGLGLEPEFQGFEDGGRPWCNLSVDFAGETTGVICLVDHYDTAIDEGSIESGDRGRYLAAPGADDNGTGTAALLEAGRLFAGMFGHGVRPRRTLRLLHLTGEEYPADSLGARRYVERCLRRGERLEGVFVLDMLGHRAGPRPGSFQLSEGESPRSGGLSGRLLAAWRELERTVNGRPLAEPLVRPRFDRLSYLYNADSVIFSDAGFPTLLVNEHLNRFEGLERRGYHDRFDTTRLLDFRYAVDLARASVAAALAAAME